MEEFEVKVKEEQKRNRLYLTLTLSAAAGVKAASCSSKGKSEWIAYSWNLLIPSNLSVSSVISAIPETKTKIPVPSTPTALIKFTAREYCSLGTLCGTSSLLFEPILEVFSARLLAAPAIEGERPVLSIERSSR
jgi:hypothetical protein